MTIAEQLRARWEAIGAERKKAIGDNPAVMSIEARASEFWRLFMANEAILSKLERGDGGTEI